jgi:hypothetical protein
LIPPGVGCGALPQTACCWPPPEYAYGAEITGLMEAAGLAAAPPRLAGVEPAVLVGTERCARLWLRWQAAGPDSAVFAALDADLTLSPAGEQTTVLAVAGVYRLPGQVGTGLDPDLVRCFAATIRRFIAWLACALTAPASTAVPTDRTRPERRTR